MNTLEEQNLKKEYRLKFANPVFHKGLNTTVRLGNRLKELPEIQETFDIVGSEKKGRLVYKDWEYLEDLPLWVLEREHDPKCHSAEGLLSALRAENMLDVVTVVGFYLV